MLKYTIMAALMLGVMGSSSSNASSNHAMGPGDDEWKNLSRSSTSGPVENGSGLFDQLRQTTASPTAQITHMAVVIHLQPAETQAWIAFLRGQPGIWQKLAPVIGIHIIEPPIGSQGSTISYDKNDEAEPSPAPIRSMADIPGC